MFQSSLIDPTNILNTKEVTPKLCAETQTSPTKASTKAELKKNKILKVLSHENLPAVARGKYPCKLQECKQELSYDLLLRHIRDCHRDNIIEKV